MGDSVLSNFWEHASIFLAGSTALSLLAHAVNTFPTPSNPYGKWFLGVVQFFVGQRQAAKNTLQGSDSVSVPVPQGTAKLVTVNSQSAVENVQFLTGTGDGG